MDKERRSGKLVTADGGIPNGNEEIDDLLFRCLKWSEIVLER
jgi:hypothetical protein